MNDLISIVLPVYNGERYLKESIESILAQTYTNWELLILDDCSNDSTASIAKYYQNLDNRIYYYRNDRNLRLPGNLNKGFSLANGDYLTWTSDDNRYHKEALKVMLTTLKEDSQAEFVYTSYNVIDEDGNNLRVFYADPRGKEHILGSNVVGACFMYSRKAYETIGDYNPDLILVEDFDYWQRMFVKFDAVALSDVLYDYRWHDASLTSTKRQDEFNNVLEKMLLSNRPAFGKLSVEANFYYYSSLFNIHKDRGLKNPYLFNYYISWCKFILFYKIPFKLGLKNR